MGDVSLGTRLALTIGSALLILSALLFNELTSRERDGILHAKAVAAATVADLFANGTSAALDFSDIDAIDADIHDFAVAYDVTCAAVWQGDDSKPIAASKTDQCVELLAPHDDALGRTVTFPDRLEVARAVTAHGKPLGRTLLVFSLSRENASISASRSRLLALFAVLTGGSALLLILVVRRQIVTPVSALVNAARRVGMGDYKARVDVSSGDEIGVLSRAFNAMGEAIADREDKLEAATRSLRELFEAMQQIIVAFDVNGRIEGEASRAALEGFGGASLTGKDVRTLLYPSRRTHAVEATAFNEWLAVAFDLSGDQWADVAALAPTEVTFEKDDGPHTLELAFRPILKGDRVIRVMLLASDVTESRALKKSMRDQREEHDRRMSAMRRLLAGGGQVFVAFLDGSRERLERSAQILEEGKRAVLTSQQIDELFRHAHTLKGEARAFDLLELEAAAVALEQDLDTLRGDARSGSVPASSAMKLLPHLERARAEVERAVDVFVAASPIGKAALDQIAVQRHDVADLVEWVRTSERALPGMRASGPLAKLIAIADRLASRPFGESTLFLVEAAPTWATREGKVVTLEVEGRDVRVPPKVAAALGPALVHLVRNAIAHGVEAPDDRKAVGKPNFGIVRLSATDGGNGPIVTVEDDGAGLDRKKIAARAEELDTQPDDGVAEIIFAAGFSTAGPQSTISGRGVGLSAVREELARAGYAIEVSTQPGKMTRFSMRPLTSQPLNQPSPSIPPFPPK
jgi:two-component system, chemotaxis family, sensor kinase CheA